MGRSPLDTAPAEAATLLGEARDPRSPSQLARTSKRGISAAIAAAFSAWWDRSRTVWSYFLLTYVVLLINASGYLRHISYDGIWTVLFVSAIYVTYTFFYLTPLLLVLVLLIGVGRLRLVHRLLGTHASLGRWLLYGVMCLGTAAIQYLVFVDRTVFGIFGFHLNGFVWNLVTTKGGIESLGGGHLTTVAAVLVGLACLAIQVSLLLLILKVNRVRRRLDTLGTGRAMAIGAAFLVVVASAGQFAYGLSSFREYVPILAAADTFPCFVPVTFQNLATTHGFQVDRDATMAIDRSATQLNYPLREIRRAPPARPLNIVWLVSESMRADMLAPDIMPRAWALSEKSHRFEHHYSGGNGTRMGMFSMFYGLYGPYWFSFLGERRGPVLIDTLIDMNYQMEVYTGAMFSYPEFDRTIFVRLPSSRLHQGGGMPAWRQDQRHISSMIEFIKQRDRSRPFMTFMFFESPHANYSFSKSSIVRRPFATGLNYATMDIERDIGLIKNRYINACNQVDSQVGRILDCLKAENLLDSTLVLITGDHGEEFMEKGRWGHNSEFTEEQTVVPMVLWAPGESPRAVTRITSHLDIPATILTLLGVSNPPEDYSQGYDLLGGPPRRFTVISDWYHVAYVDDEFKAVFATSAMSGFRRNITTATDGVVENPSAFYEQHRDQIVELMRALKTFDR